jgi:HEAT repeat protein
MKTDAEIKVLELLKGGRALSIKKRQEILASLSTQERAALEKIAAGELGDDDPRSEGKAVSALGMMLDQAAPSRALLRSLVSSPKPAVQTKAIQALGKQPGAEDLPLLARLIRDPTTHPGAALAAARIVSAAAGSDAVAGLIDLRKRFLALMPNERSPSIVALDRLIRQAQGEAAQPRVGQPKPIV